MRTLTPESDSLSAAAAPPRRTAGRLASRSWQLARKYPFPALCAVVLLVIGIASGLAGVLAGDPSAIDFDAQKLGPLSGGHLFGTDNLGRDVLSRILYGGRVTLAISVTSVALATVVALTLGMLAGYLQGWPDRIIMRITDVLMSFPGLIIVISLVAFYPGGGLPLLTGSIALVLLGGGIRVARGATLQVATYPYVEAANAMGARTPRVLIRHIAPNIFPPVMVIATAYLGIAIIIEATASFLGYGVQPPTPSWGVMLGTDARTHMIDQPWLSVFPGLAIFLTVFSFNIIGDSLRDGFDPRLRGA